MPRSDDSRQSQKRAPAPPEAIPGSKARLPVAPATRSVNDMDPTEALFDAINRGDIAAARDALSRGADLNGVNVLGMTPMELSVDLGRNDISFLLLSMRGEDGSRAARTASRSAGSKAPDKVLPLPSGAQSARNKPNAATPRPPKIAAEKPIGTPKLWAHDGGSPQPSVGFLGFGAREASN